MTKLEWDSLWAREIRAGVDRGVIYPRIGSPVVWNGLVSVIESAEDADHSVAYFDGQAYVQRRGTEGFAASVEAVTYPDQLDTQAEFDFSYRLEVGDGHEIHLVYNVRLSSRDLSLETEDSTAKASTFKWSMTTTPERIDNVRATAHVIINTSNTAPAVLEKVLNLIYGMDAAPPRMPHLPELNDIYDTYGVFRVIDNGDGTWSAIGPDSWIEMLDATTFQITSPSAVYLDAVTYKLGSW